MSDPGQRSKTSPIFKQGEAMWQG